MLEFAIIFSFNNEICFDCNECFFFLYIICYFEIFSTVNSSMASNMAAQMENPFCFEVFFSKNNHIFAISIFDIT